MKTIGLLLCVIFCISCTKEDNDPRFYDPELVGFYDFVSYESDIAVDLDENDVKNKNILLELKFFINRSQSDMRVWQRSINNQSDYFYNLTFPNLPAHQPNAMWQQRLLETIQDALLFNIDEKYQILDKKYMQLEYSDRGVFTLSEIIILPNKNIKISGTQQFFDYDLNNWVIANVVAIAKKR